MSNGPDLVYGTINSALFGLNPSARMSNYQIHPLIRNNWQSSDRLRDALGCVPSITEQNDTSPPKVRQNFAGTIGKPLTSPGCFDHDFCHSTSWIMEEPLQANLIVNPTSPASAGSYSRYYFKTEFDASSWNTINLDTLYVSYNHRANMKDLLHEESVAPEYAGVPYFVRYFALSDEGLRSGLLTTDPRMQGADEDVDPIMNSDQMLRTMWDHSFEYHMYDRTIPDSGYDIEINPVYNYFLDSDPDYESVIAPNAVAESLIPNYYMIEVLRSETPTRLASGLNWQGAYLTETSFDGSMRPWVGNFFQGIIPSSMPETQAMSRGYLQFYASTLETGIPDLAGGVAEAAAIYNSKYKNIAVLTPEIQEGFLESFNLAVLDDRGTENDPTDDLSAISAYPYYNEIIIPHDNQHADGASSSNFYDQLITAGLTSDEAQKFLTLVQLYISYTYSNSSTRSFTTYDKTANNSNGEYDIIQENQGLRTVFDLETFIQQLNDDGSETSITCRHLAKYYDKGHEAREALGPNTAQPDFVPLRTKFQVNSYFMTSTVGTNWEQVLDPEQWLSLDHTGALFDGLHEARLVKIATAISQIVREPPEFWNGVIPMTGQQGFTYAPSESIMYAVEKRRVPAGQLAASPSSDPVQTFFFGRDYANQNKKGIRYIDTQIKYGVKYQYDIKQVRLVFGNRYAYGNQTRSVVNVPTFGRAIGNALGFFAPERYQSGHGLGDPGSYVVDDSTETADRILAKTGIADHANPKRVPIPPGLDVNLPDHLHPSYIPSNFSWLPEDGELRAADPNRGFYGYYVYRFKQVPNEALYRTVDAFAAGALNRTHVEDHNMDANIDLSLLIIELMRGPGFDGNPSGGAMPGTHPIGRYAYTPPTPESPPDERPGGPDGGDLGGPKDGPGHGTDTFEEGGGEPEGSNDGHQGGDGEGQQNQHPDPWGVK